MNKTDQFNHGEHGEVMAFQWSIEEYSTHPAGGWKSSCCERFPDFFPVLPVVKIRDLG